MLEIIKEVFEVINTSNEIIERIIGFRIIDAAAVIFIVSVLNSAFSIRKKYEKRHTVILSLLCIVISITWAAAGVSFDDLEGLVWFKAIISHGFKLASVATLSYNIFKPVTRPLINRFYDWLRSKGVEVPEVEEKDV